MRECRDMPRNMYDDDVMHSAPAKIWTLIDILALGSWHFFALASLAVSAVSPSYLICRQVHNNVPITAIGFVPGRKMVTFPIIA